MKKILIWLPLIGVVSAFVVVAVANPRNGNKVISC